MKKQLLAGAMAAGLVLGGVNIAVAAPGPNGKNDKGLCTAYYNGQKKGHDKNGNPPPFQQLIDDADGADGSDPDGTTTPEEVMAFCDGMIGGNPENGRFADQFDSDGDGDATNESTGKGKR